MPFHLSVSSHCITRAAPLMDIQLHHDRVGQLRIHGNASPGTCLIGKMLGGPWDGDPMGPLNNQPHIHLIFPMIVVVWGGSQKIVPFFFSIKKHICPHQKPEKHVA